MFEKNISKLDRSANVKNKLNGINTFTLSKKEIFNEIHDEFQMKLEKLEFLKRKLSDLDARDLESKEIEEILQNKRNELALVRNDLSEESMYTDTLKYMINRCRDSAKKAGIPINIKNEELFRQNLDIKKDQRETKQALMEAKQLKKKIKKMKKEMHSEKSEKTQGLEFRLRIYEDQQRLKKCLEIEKKRQQILEKNKQNIKKLQELDAKIADLKQENMIEKEVVKLNRHIDYQERKFKAIQRITNSPSIDDVLPYFYYLMDNKESLENQCNSSLALISSLISERDILSKSLKKMQFEEEFILTDENTLALEGKCLLAENDLSEKESSLEKLELLMLYAINTLSRIVFQLSEEQKIDIIQDNVALGVGMCFIRIERMMEAIQTYQNVYYIESINTDMHYRAPPSFLNLNAHSLSIKHSMGAEEY